MRMLPCLLLISAVAFGQKDAQPRVVDPGDGRKAPSDAVALFNGRDMTGWITKDGKIPKCEVEAGGVMACVTGVGDIQTTQTFKNAQIHLEFAIPYMPNQKGQLRGNSGVYLQGKYEMQILDSYQNPTYAHGSLGGLYNQAPPLVNAARRPEEWQTYDFIFRGPECDTAGKVTKKAVVTVLLNGLLVHDHVAIDASEKLGAGCQAGPILLQDHSGFKDAPITKMKFRNLWLRELD